MKSFSGFLSDCHVSSFRRFFTALILFALIPVLTPAQVSINTDGSAPHSSSMLEVKSSARGFLAPRMTSAQRSAIASPAAGLIVYQTDGTTGYYFYNGSSWQRLGIALNDYWLPNGADIYYNAGKAAIGTTVSLDQGLNVINFINGKGAVRGANQNISVIYSEGFLGFYNPGATGAPVSVTHAGVLGIKPNEGSNGAAVYGWNNDDNLTNYGGVFIADGNQSGQNANHGIYCLAKKAAFNYAGSFTGRVKVESHISSGDALDYTLTLFSAEVKHSSGVNTKAIEGISSPASGWGTGVYGKGGKIGVHGLAEAGNAAEGWGVFGNVTGTTGNGYAVYGIATGGGAMNIGVYGTASGATKNWAGYFYAGDTYIHNDLLVGTLTKATGYAVSVNGNIACEEVLVDDVLNWPDFVFSDGYELTGLHELEQSIRQHGHLPGIPSAPEIEENGLLLGDMQSRMLEKIEELTLYLINQNKRIEALEAEINQLKSGKKTAGNSCSRAR